MATEPVDPYALMLCWRSLAVLLGAGVSLVRTLRLVADQAEDEPLREALAWLVERVEAESFLSAAMAERPAVFAPLQVAMTRAGEVGGILDETADALARHLEWRLELRERMWVWTELARQRGEGADAAVRERIATAVAAAETDTAQMHFCRALGMMLAGGVPLVQALDCAGALLGPERTAAVRELVAGLRRGDRLAEGLDAVGGFAPTAVQLCAIGEETGNLDRLLLQAADLLETRAQARLRHATLA